MIIINVLPCLEALIDLFSRYEKQYTLNEDKQTASAKQFFYVRASILGFLISRDALTSVRVEALDELEPNLKYVQDLYIETYNKNVDIYYTKNDKVYA